MVEDLYYIRNADGTYSQRVSMEGATFNATIDSVGVNNFPAVQAVDQQSKTLAVVLQDAVTITGVGTPFAVGAFKTLTISITGTSTSRTILFEIADADGNYTPIQGTRLNDIAMDIQTIGTSEKWTFEVTGVTTFRANITAIAGGNVSIKGTAVA